MSKRKPELNIEAEGRKFPKVIRSIIRSRTGTPAPSGARPTPLSLLDASPSPALSGLSGASPAPPSSVSEDTPRPSVEPSSHPQRPRFDGIFVDGAGPPQTAANLAGDIAYKGFKALLDVLDKVGYALPPLKAAAAGLSRVMTVIDTVVQNKADYDTIRQKLEAILSIAQKHAQNGPQQRPLDLRVKELANAIERHTREIKCIQERSFVRRAFDNAQDAAAIANSFREIVILMNGFEMDTELHIESRVEEILQRVDDANATGLHIKAKTEEVWNRFKDEELIRRLPYAEYATYRTRQAPDDQEPQGCMGGTREQILADLEGWALDDAAPKVFWLNGMAGTGKTSIAHSLCEKLHEHKLLGASFFCSRSASSEVRDARFIIPTIASTLSQVSPMLRSAMREVIEEQPDVGFLHKLSAQFRLLLVDPIQRINDSSVKTYVIVIDALDECTNLGTVEKLIQAIVGFAPEMRLKLFISSRDITQIWGAFHHNPNYMPTIVSLHTIERTVVQGDIKRYLHTSLSAIIAKNWLSIAWPPSDEFEILLERSDGLFIYAVTALRYIGAPGVDFRERLTHITRLTPARMQMGDLVSLYNDIMRQAFHSQLEPEEVSRSRRVLSAVVFLMVPLSMDAIASLLSMDSLQAQFALAPFRSVIHVPAVNIGLVTIFHASFPNFIVNPSRCEESFRLNQSEGNRMLTVQCLWCLNWSLECNICNLDTNMTVSSSHRPNAIPDALRYSCLHWASHLAQALGAALAENAVAEIQALVSMFVNQHLLHWFECLSALKELESGITSLDIAYECISARSREPIGYAGIAPLLNDARRFLQVNFELIKQHPLRMYKFAHVWIPEKSLMRERYAAVLGQTPRVVFGLSQSWEPVLHVIQHPNWVNSVAFSPDGSRLASGSDKIVRIWNTATGELEDELEGHTDLVKSVAFSHNGQLIVSGSWDKTVRIWNTATCETTYMLTGHTNKVMSVAISRNEEFVVSGSSDGTVRVWDTATGEVLRELKGHGDEVMSVAVSPDCEHIASGSNVGEVWIWTKDGIIEHKLECPTNEENVMYDVAFSHDGHRILSSANRTEWTIMGHRLSQPDTDDDPDFMSIAYSPDDSEIVCGMEDGMVMIWNRETNETHTLGRHSGVRSVAFSPDGNRIASGCGNSTLRIWDPRLQGTFTEELDLGWPKVALSCDGRWIVTASNHHIQVWRLTETMTKTNQLSIEYVDALVLSRDGSLVVFGCYDGRIWVWNHLTNTIECQMIGHSRPVWHVAFSYDGSHVVSVSSDKTVRIWDCYTGNEVALYHHSATCVAFSRDGGRVAFADGGDVAFGDDGRAALADNYIVQIWNPSTGETHTNSDNLSRGYRVDSIAFSYDGNHVICGGYGGVWIWNVMANTSTMLFEQIQLPDGTRVHPLGEDQFHIYDPVDLETTNSIPPYLLSISPDRNWITGEQGEHICWIHPQYRAFDKAHIAKSIVCLQVGSGIIVLDLKNTQHAGRIMPGI